MCRLQTRSFRAICRLIFCHVIFYGRRVSFSQHGFVLWEVSQRYLFESRAEVSQFAHHSVCVNANFHVSDFSDMERIVSVTEDMKHDLSVGDMACDVDVTSGDVNAKKT